MLYSFVYEIFIGYLLCTKHSGIWHRINQPRCAWTFSIKGDSLLKEIPHSRILPFCRKLNWSIIWYTLNRLIVLVSRLPPLKELKGTGWLYSYLHIAGCGLQSGFSNHRRKMRGRFLTNLFQELCTTFLSTENDLPIFKSTIELHSTFLFFFF